LRDSGAEVEVLVTSWVDERSRAFDRAAGYRIVRMSHGKVRGTTSFRLLARVMWMLLSGRYDWVLCGSAQPVTYPVYAASRLFGSRYIVQTFGEDLQDVDHRPRKRALLSRALRRARRVIAVSSYAGRELGRFGINADSVEVIHPGIEPDPYLNVSDVAVGALRNRLGLNGRRVLLTVARLDARKGHDVVIRALPCIAAEAPDVTYLVVGKGDSRELKELAERLEVGRHIKFVDYVADEDLPALYSMADVYVMVSRTDEETGATEGFGICYAEAAMCGRPSVAARAGGAPDAVIDEVTGFLVDEKDANAVTDKVLSLLKNPELARRMGEAGRERAVCELTRAKMLERYTEAFSRAIS
jgi:phosphatidylinositol alpha-1,6-mannosyltransferase